MLLNGCVGTEIWQGANAEGCLSVLQIAPSSAGFIFPFSVLQELRVSLHFSNNCVTLLRGIVLHARRCEEAALQRGCKQLTDG
jgi:hypothetical protein